MRFSPLAAFLAATLACSSTDSLIRREIGVIVPGGVMPPVIEAPDTVIMGQPFAVVINTFGSSSCTTPDGVTMTSAPGRRTITPYDLIKVGDGVVCTRDIAPQPHPVDLTFSAEGTARIEVRGYLASGTVPERTLTLVSKDLEVVPAATPRRVP